MRQRTPSSLSSPVKNAEDTLEFSEALIEYVFTYRDKFEEFKMRRAKVASSSKEKSPKQQVGQDPAREATGGQPSAPK